MAQATGILSDLKRAVSTALNEYEDETAIQLAERMGKAEPRLTHHLGIGAWVKLFRSERRKRMVRVAPLLSLFPDYPALAKLPKRIFGHEGKPMSRDKATYWDARSNYQKVARETKARVSEKLAAAKAFMDLMHEAAQDTKGINFGAVCKRAEA